MGEWCAGTATDAGWQIQDSKVGTLIDSELKIPDSKENPSKIQDLRFKTQDSKEEPHLDQNSFRIQDSKEDPRQNSKEDPPGMAEVAHREAHTPYAAAEAVEYLIEAFGVRARLEAWPHRLRPSRCPRNRRHPAISKPKVGGSGRLTDGDGALPVLNFES